MSEFESLELELAALLPREPSAELERRIARRLAEAASPRPKKQPPMWRGGALVAGLLAASVVAVLAWQGEPPRASSAPTASSDLDVAIDLNESLPSIWSYRTATTRSAESLNELLDKYANQTLVSQAGRAPAFVVERSSITSKPWLGEL